jgi:hypothetical protein
MLKSCYRRRMCLFNYQLLYKDKYDSFSTNDHVKMIDLGHVSKVVIHYFV